MDWQAKIDAIEATGVMAVYAVVDVVDGSEKIAVVRGPVSKTYMADHFDRLSAEDVITDMDALWDARRYSGD